MKTLPNPVSKIAQAPKAPEASIHVSCELTPDPSVTVRSRAHSHPFEPQVKCVSVCAPCLPALWCLCPPAAPSESPSSLSVFLEGARSL